MPRHKTIAIRGDDLLARVESATDAPWRDVLRIDHEELDTLYQLAEPTEADLARMDALDAAARKEIREVWFVASWPEHVICPEFDGDAGFYRCRSEAEARSEADRVYGE